MFGWVAARAEAQPPAAAAAAPPPSSLFRPALGDANTHLALHVALPPEWIRGNFLQLLETDDPALVHFE